MNSKKLTYFQFKKIASTLGDKIKDPKEVANISGITDIDYDLLHEYLTKWHQEKNTLEPHTQFDTIDTLEDSEDQQQDNFENLEKKSLMALFRSTLESSNDGIIIIDNDGKLIDWNDKFFEIAKIPPEALEQGLEEVGLEHIFNQVKDPQKLMIELGRLEEENSMKGDFGEVEFLDGRTIERYTQPLILDNKPVGRVWCFKDITEEKARKDRINILTSAIQSATQGIVVLDEDAVVYINDYLRATLEIEEFDINNNKIININNNKLNILYRKITQQLINKEDDNIDSSAKSERLLEMKDSKGKQKWYELSTFISEYNEKKYTLGIINDITKNKVLEDQLSYNAYHDLLTGLPNRNKLLTIMRAKIINKESFAVYFIDLDNFKLINDSLGHHIGDLLLKNFGQKLSKFVKQGNTVGRLGGDEFVIIVNNIVDREDNEPHVEIVKKLISKPIKVRDYEFNLTLSMGVAQYPYDAATPDDLIKNADSAMYQKKSGGKNGVAFYDSSIRTRNVRKMTIANKIHKAIANNELSLNYQPIYDLATKRISSLEALIRWNNEDLGGFVNPEEFIAVCEEVGYIDTITYWVFKKGLQQLKNWHQQGYKDLRLTLNLSGALLYNPSIIDKLNKIVADSSIDPKLITVELTENVFINDNADIITMLNKMSDIGLKIAIDDFGTGYSSFAYLQKLPIDVIKIDKMFTQSLFEDNACKENTAIILSIIELGRHAGYDIVAEGIETINQMGFLAEHKCKYGQGYHFSRPLPDKDITSLLHEDSLKE